MEHLAKNNFRKCQPYFLHEYVNLNMKRNLDKDINRLLTFVIYETRESNENRGKLLK